MAMDRPEALKAAFQGSQSVLAAFDIPVDPEKLRSMPSVHRIETEADKIRLYTSYPGRVAAGVVDFAKQNNLEILSLNTMAPSLEDVFVSLAHESHEPAERKEP